MTPCVQCMQLLNQLASARSTIDQLVSVARTDLGAAKAALSLALDQLAGNAGTIKALRESFDEHKAEIERLRESEDRLHKRQIERDIEIERLRTELYESTGYWCCAEFSTGSGEHGDECPRTKLTNLRVAAERYHGLNVVSNDEHLAMLAALEASR